MFRAIAAATLCTAMFAAGAEAAPAYRITADGTVFSLSGEFASGFTYAIPIRSTAAIDISALKIDVTRDAASGTYGGRSTGWRGAATAPSRRVGALDLFSTEIWGDAADNFAVTSALSAFTGGLLAAGTYDLISFGFEVDVPSTDNKRLSASLTLFAPNNALERWTSLSALALDAVVGLIEFSYRNDFGADDHAFAAVTDLSIASTPVPLPAAAPLLVAGLAGLGFAGRRRVRP
jgi:hypothetical protein